jgi:hypothetical protein
MYSHFHFVASQPARLTTNMKAGWDSTPLTSQFAPYGGLRPTFIRSGMVHEYNREVLILSDENTLIGQVRRIRRCGLWNSFLAGARAFGQRLHPILWIPAQGRERSLLIPACRIYNLPY